MMCTLILNIYGPSNDALSCFLNCFSLLSGSTNIIITRDFNAVINPSVRRLVVEFCQACEERKLHVNVSKSKVPRCSRCAVGGAINVSVNGERMEEVEGLKYLGS